MTTLSKRVRMRFLFFRQSLSSTPCSSEQISDKPISARQFSCSSYEPSKSEVMELFSKLVSNDESKEGEASKKGNSHLF